MSQYVLGDAFTDLVAQVSTGAEQAKGMFDQASGMFAAATGTKPKAPPKTPVAPPASTGRTTDAFRKIVAANRMSVQTTAVRGSGSTSSGSSMPSTTVLALGAAAVIAAFLLLK
jgi:hypothetical protein